MWVVCGSSTGLGNVFCLRSICIYWYRLGCAWVLGILFKILEKNEDEALCAWWGNPACWRLVYPVYTFEGVGELSEVHLSKEYRPCHGLENISSWDRQLSRLRMVGGLGQFMLILISQSWCGAALPEFRSSLIQLLRLRDNFSTSPGIRGTLGVSFMWTLVKKTYPGCIVFCSRWFLLVAPPWSINRVFYHLIILSWLCR